MYDMVSNRNAIKEDYRKWPGGVVPYVISSRYNSYERSIIAKAMQEYKRNTCIKYVFKYLRNFPKIYIYNFMC